MADHRVAIIGAGVAGVCMAIELKRAGVDSFAVFEKTAEVGGVWRENTYPGAGCDLPSHLYSYSFARYGEWTNTYAAQPQILDYLRHCADTYRIRPHIHFRAEVTQADFDTATNRWRLRTADGAVHTAQVLITAVGQLHRPRVPELPGAGDFNGKAFHSARWDHGHQLAGKSVAVIGNGCSAVQFVPRIAPEVRKLHVFQRSPKWIIPKLDRKFLRPTRWLFKRIPLLQKLNRASWFLMAETIAYSPIHRGLLGRGITAMARFQLRRQIRDPRLRAKLRPDYAFGCNRMILSNDYYPALNRENVDLVTEPISRVTGNGILTADGQLHQVDTIIYATGFHSTQFLAPIRITGPGGELHERWRDGASAYLGLAVPGFPNLFTLYGPNSSSASNSVIYMLESQVSYVLRCLEVLGEQQSMEVTEQAHAEFAAFLGKELALTVWGGDCRSWYKTEGGKITGLWPLRASAYRRATRKPDLAHFHIAVPVPTQRGERHDHHVFARHRV